MRRLAALLLALPLVAAAQSQPLLAMEEFVNDWKVSRDFTLAVAEKMPAEFYGFIPSPGQRSFGEQMLHLAGAAAFRFHQLTGMPPPRVTPPDPNDKAAVMQFVKFGFEEVIGLLPKITPQQLTQEFKVDWKGRPEASGREMMLGMFVHTAHHRAQCEVYLRLKNIVPPDYLF
jgi:uncharacterized damage-inducible protein DinB